MEKTITEQKTNDSVLLSQKGSKSDVEELIRQIVNESTMIRLKKRDLLYLYQEYAVLKRMLYSFPRKNENRMEAILREVMEMSLIEFSEYTKLILLIETSPQHPLLMEELYYIDDIVALFPNCAEIKWGLGADSSLEKQVFLMMVCSR